MILGLSGLAIAAIAAVILSATVQVIKIVQADRDYQARHKEKAETK